MRIHRLQLTAFGPFPGTEVVDLDTLASGGLFLLHGPTGAGKTSVLDAVCFALYGRVAGSRGGAARLRSDHAEPSVAPEVVCEFSIGERRFEVTRSPAWERPKKRGTGTTTEQTRVAVRERDDDGWRVLTTRTDEAAQLLDRLLGLGLDQFTKLVLLPQGEFAAFLRADAEVRRQMLERLFATDRFAAVQQWVRQRQLDLRHEVDAALTGTDLLLAQARQAAVPLALPDPTAQPDPATEVGRLQRAARLAWEEATAHRLGTQDALRRAAGARREGESLTARQREHANATLRMTTLATTADEQQNRRERLERAVRAAGLVPVAATLEAARTRAGSTTRRLDAAVARARQTSALDAGPTAEALADSAAMEHACAAGRRLLATLTEVERDARRRAELEAEIIRHDRAVRQATTQAEQARGLLADVQTELAAWRDRRGAAATGAAREDGARARLAADDAVVAAVHERDRRQREVADAELARDQARRSREDARERWLDLRERRLAGIAAELAAGLAPGSSCPVCGSAEHPSPATSDPVTGSVDRATEQAAQHLVEVAEQTLGAAEQSLTALTHQLAAARQIAGEQDPATAQRRRAEAAAELDAVHAALAELARADDRLNTLADDLAGWTTRREAADVALQTASTALAAAQEVAAELRQRVAGAGGEGSDPGERRRRWEAWTAALEAALVAGQESSAGQALLADALAEADAAATAAGFATVAEAVTAVSQSPALTELRAAIRRHDDELAAVTDRLADPALVAAAGQPAAPLGALIEDEQLSRSDDDAATARAAVCETAVTALDHLAARLRSHLHGTAPVLDRYRTAEQLSRCLDGTGGDNTRRMSLSAYVLAARLEQVAQAATERLAAMSGGRYRLVHSDGLERGRVRSGLSLKVVDEWTGAERETSSLSGGESFYTALALALGLADVVTAESGGASVETLFVDEGFGSLDEDTLDEVMDVLDTLRSGGRAVGLVSHVADLRTRIPSRLEVVKTPSGSHLQSAAG